MSSHLPRKDLSVTGLPSLPVKVKGPPMAKAVDLPSERGQKWAHNTPMAPKPQSTSTARETRVMRRVRDVMNSSDAAPDRPCRVLSAGSPPLCPEVRDWRRRDAVAQGESKPR